MYIRIIYVYKGILYHVLNELNDVISYMYVLLCYYMFVFYIVMYGGWMGGSRIQYSIKNLVLIRDSVSEISP